MQTPGKDNQATSMHYAIAPGKDDKATFMQCKKSSL